MVFSAADRIFIRVAEQRRDALLTRFVELLPVAASSEHRSYIIDVRVTVPDACSEDDLCDTVLSDEGWCCAEEVREDGFKLGIGVAVAFVGDVSSDTAVQDLNTSRS